MLSIDVETDLGALSLRARIPGSDGITILIGPNGAGKTSLLLSILGIIKPHRGRVSLGGSPLYCSETGVDVPPCERRLGYLPQRYALFPHMTVTANVAFGIRGCRRREREARASALLERFGVAHLGRRLPPSLSGGEAQRVALARALAIEPRALLLDEPMAALDAGARSRVRDLLGTRLRSLGVPTVIVSHDVADAEALGGKIVVLERGRITRLGTLAELRRAPGSSFVRRYLEAEVEPAEEWTPGGRDRAHPPVAPLVVPAA